MRAAALALFAAIGCGGTAPAPATPVVNTTKPAPAPAPTPTPAAASFEDELVHGHPTAQRFNELVDAFPAMSAQRRATLAAIGTSEDAPIHVPSIDYEYVWVAKIACNGGAGQVGVQALLETPKGELDKLDFTCPGDQASHAAYFDFSDDPTEQQMKKELGN